MVLACIRVDSQEPLRLHRPCHPVGRGLVQAGGASQIAQTPLRVVYRKERKHPQSARQSANDELIVALVDTRVREVRL